MLKPNKKPTLGTLQGLIINLDQKLTSRIDGLDQKIDGVEQRLSKKIDEEIEGLDFMVSNGFNDVHKQIGNLHQEMNFKFDGVNRRIDDLADTRVRIEVHEALEKRVEKLEHKRMVK